MVFIERPFMRMFQRSVVNCALTLVVLAIPMVQQAKAYTVLLATNLGSGGTYSSGEYLLQGNPLPSENVAQSFAVSFVPGVSALIQDVVLPLSSLLGPPAIIVGIASDNSGLPGGILTMLTQNGTISSSTTLVSFTCSGACPLLSAGTRYWIVTSPQSGSTFVEWHVSSNENGNYAFNNNGSINGPWSLSSLATPGIQVDGLIPGLAPQTITFDSIPNQIFGTSPFPIVAHASSNLPVALSSTTPAVCKIAGGLLALLAAGTCSITASQSGNASYSAAPSVTHNVSVSPAKPSGTLTAAPGSPFIVGVGPEAVVVGDFTVMVFQTWFSPTNRPSSYP
jgi:hypothetical protein